MEIALLFDFFGELLPAKQREYIDLYYNEDLSLSEIAENAGISRQGVRDALVHGERTLREYEAKTGVVSRFSALQHCIDALVSKARALRAQLPEDETRRMTDEIIDGLSELKG